MSAPKGFIVVTSVADGRVSRIHVTHILAYCLNVKGEHTVLITSECRDDEHRLVVETPEQIDALIIAAQTDGAA